MLLLVSCKSACQTTRTVLSMQHASRHKSQLRGEGICLLASGQEQGLEHHFPQQVLCFGVIGDVVNVVNGSNGSLYQVCSLGDLRIDWEEH